MEWWGNSYQFAQMVGDSLWNSVTLLLPCEGSNNGTTFTDVSPTPKSVTRAGDVKTITTVADFFGRNSGVAAYDGVGDTLTIGAQLLNPTQWTVEMLIRPTSLATNRTLFSQYLVSDANRTIFSITTTGALQIFNGAQGVNTSANGVISANNWNFVTITRNGSTVTGYVGTSQVVQKTNFVGPYAANTIFGGYFGFSDEQFAGQMQMIRVTSAIRTVAIPSAPFPQSL